MRSKKQASDVIQEHGDVTQAKNIYKLALQAGLCYNQEVNIVVAKSVTSTLSLLTRSVLRRRVTMDTVPYFTLIDNIPHKYCPRCKTFKPATLKFFHSAKDRGDGLCGWCKVCRHTFNKVPPEKNRLTQLKYDRGHKEAKRVSCNTRRSRKKSVTGTFTSIQIQEKLKLQKYKCYYCSAKFQCINKKYIYHVEHTFPLSRVVGTGIPANDISYLVLACPTCNLSKGDRFPWEFPEGGKLL